MKYKGFSLGDGVTVESCERHDASPNGWLVIMYGDSDIEAFPVPEDGFMNADSVGFIVGVLQPDTQWEVSNLDDAQDLGDPDGVRIVRSLQALVRDTFGEMFKYGQSF